MRLMELIKEHHTEGQLETTDHEHWTDLIDRGSLWQQLINSFMQLSMSSEKSG